MQLDMHFYGTYALARAAGIPKIDAMTIAYAAQYVDDSNKKDSAPHEDGGLLFGIATAHSSLQCVGNHHIDFSGNCEEQRKVWVPFHFLPGAEGTSFEEKLLCRKNSQPAQDMMKNHIELALQKDYGLELLGIAAHVYMDTFAHYGFSGISSSMNAINDASIETHNLTNREMEQYVLDRKGAFLNLLGLESIASFIAEDSTGSLGHGAVATFPDRPFLEWSFEYERPRANGETKEHRDNKKTFLEGCQNLHGYFSNFATRKYEQIDAIPFNDISIKLENIIAFEGKCEERIQQWLTLEQNGTPLLESEIKYSESDWEKQKDLFDEKTTSSDSIESNVYRFHQAAAYHRYYVLKDLLPSHGLAVY